MSSCVGEKCIRKYWLDKMTEITEPVLKAASLGRLGLEIDAEGTEERKSYAVLEAVCRSLLGIAPWLESSDEDEKEVRENYASMAREAIKSIVDPSSPDYGGFNSIKKGEFASQILVEGAILSFAILRAPVELWKKLDIETKDQVIKALRYTRKTIPAPNNWVLFSAMVEAFFYKIGEDYDSVKIDWALEKMEGWYAGDGFYKDGDRFHLDYYNSLIIHPMLMEILHHMSSTQENWKKFQDREDERAKRYVEVLEKFIGPEGVYPVVGRSVCYRFGVFFHLSYMSLIGKLPEGLDPGQVRSALTRVIERTVESDILNDKGYLKIGVAGSQPSLGEIYINTGSLYFCTTIFTVLGLSKDNEFWKSEYKVWSSKLLWSGKDLKRDIFIK